MNALRKRDVVVIGASAGGIPLLVTLLGALDVGLGASVFIVVHRPASAASKLLTVLSRPSRLRVCEPSDGDALEPDFVYLAPADHHMRVLRSRIHVDRGPKMHHTRPAIDPLFFSASESHGSRTVGVLLSGNLGDGVGGLVAIKRQGGVSLVQDPQEAEWPSMPYNALLYDHVDLVFRVAALPALLSRLIDGAPIATAAEGLGAAERAPAPLVGRRVPDPRTKFEPR